MKNIVKKYRRIINFSLWIAGLIGFLFCLYSCLTLIYDVWIIKGLDKVTRAILILIFGLLQIPCKYLMDIHDI